MGGAIPLPTNWSVVIDQLQVKNLELQHRVNILSNERDLMRSAMAIITEQRDALQRQLEGAMQAAHSLAMDVVQPKPPAPAPAPTKEAALLRAIRQPPQGGKPQPW